MESDRASPLGKLTRPITSIGKVEDLVSKSTDQPIGISSFLQCDFLRFAGQLTQEALRGAYGISPRTLKTRHSIQSLRPPHNNRYRRSIISISLFSRGTVCITCGGRSTSTCRCAGLSEVVSASTQLHSGEFLLSRSLKKQKGKVYLVGAGPGDPDLLTVRAVRTLGIADVVLHDALVSQGVLALVRLGARIFDVGKR